MWMENPWENKRISPFPVCPEDCGCKFKADGKKIDIKDCFLRFFGKGLTEIKSFSRNEKVLGKGMGK